MSETVEFEQWLQQIGPRVDDENTELRYELRDEDHNRRLRELLESREEPGGSGEEQTALVFTTEDFKTRSRYRYLGPDDVCRWETWRFTVTTVRGIDVTADGETHGYTFEVERSVSDGELDAIDLRSEKETTVEVPFSFFNEDIRSTREFRVAGLSDERAAVREFLQANGERWGISPAHGMLLEGLPGTGKTEVVMEVCRELYGSVPVQISGPEILSRWVGESERILRERFETAREDPSGVLYIDEVDAIARSRGQSTQEYSDQIVAQLLVLLDGLDSKRSSERVKVIASTNMAGMIDEALRRPGRLGRTESFGTLDGDDAVAVLHHYLDEIRHHIRQSDESTETGELSSEVHQFIEERDLSALEKSTDEIADEGLEPILSGKTGADIEKIVQEAIRLVDENSEDDGSAAELSPRELLEAATTEDQLGEIVKPKQSEIESTRHRFSTDSPVVCVDPESGKDTVEDAFRQFLGEQDHSKGEFRSVVLNEDLVFSSPTTIRRHIWNQFRPNNQYPVCVYLHGFASLEEAMDTSEMADAAVQAVCDRLLTLPQEGSDEPPTLFGFPSNGQSNLPPLNELAGGTGTGRSAKSVAGNSLD